jgi:N-acetylmuramoyl-L-alanine amidase/TAT (twin-arginine translocation) pathway signal sequence
VADRSVRPVRVFFPSVHRRSVTRRQVLKAGAAAAALGALGPAAPALGRRPALFELDLDGVTGAATAAAAGGWRTTPVLRAPRRFDLVGLRWAHGSSAEAMVRARRRGGRWTEWAALHPTGDHAPDGEPAPAGTDPAFVGAADELQLRLRGAPRGLRARFVRALPTATVSRRLSGRAAAAARRQGVQPPPIIPRSAWGGDTVIPREAPEYGEVQVAFVHHTVTTNDYRPDESAAIVLGIARYHRDGNRWNDIGYNFLVDKYGQVFEGRAGGVELPVVGAQAQGYNYVSTGIACIGTFSSIAQSPAAMGALARLIGWKLSLHGVPTHGAVTVVSGGGPANRYPEGTPVTLERISGHRDGNATACPGDVLYGQLDDLRTASARFAGPVAGLTLLAASKVRGLRPLEVSGTLRFSDGASPAGAALDVEYQTAGSAWTRIAGATCGPDGAFSATVQLAAGGLLRAVYRGDAVHPRQESPARQVSILPVMSVAVDRTRLRRGRVVTVAGTAAPADRVRLLLQIRRGRRWVTVRRRNLAVRDGGFSVRVRLRARGRYRVTARVGSVRRRRRLTVV